MSRLLRLLVSFTASSKSARCFAPVAERLPGPTDGRDAFVCFSPSRPLNLLIYARLSSSDWHLLSASDSRRPKRCVTGALGSLSPAIRSGLARGAVGDELLPSLSETQSPALKRGAGPSTATRWLSALRAATWHRQHGSLHRTKPRRRSTRARRARPCRGRHTQHAVAAPHERERSPPTTPQAHIDRTEQ